MSQLEKNCLKLFQNKFRGLLQLMNIFQHVQCRRNNFEIISAFYFTCNHPQWTLHVKLNTKIISKLFQNNLISPVTMTLARPFGHCEDVRPFCT